MRLARLTAGPLAARGTIMDREAIEFHDSVLSSIAISRGNTRVSFSPAYLHRSTGEPGRDSGTGWSVDIELTIHDGTISSSPTGLPSDVWEGTLCIGDRRFDNVVPVPLDGESEVLLLLTLNCGEILHVSGTRVQLRVVGEYQFVETVPGG